MSKSATPILLNSVATIVINTINCQPIVLNCLIIKHPSLRGFLTPIGATFRIAPHRVGSYIFSKSCKLSLSKSRLTPVLARKRHSYTPQLRSIYPDKCTLNTQIFTELFITRGPCALLSVHSVYSVCNKAQQHSKVIVIHCLIIDISATFQVT